METAELYLMKVNRVRVAAILDLKTSRVKKIARNEIIAENEGILISKIGRFRKQETGKIHRFMVISLVQKNDTDILSSRGLIAVENKNPY